MRTVVAVDADAMRAIGERIGGRLCAGQMLILNGPLGAGKTTLVQGIARGLGISDSITSPTFVISHMHRGPSALLIHVDAYRLSNPRDLSALDLDDYLDEAVAVVEWGGNVFAGEDDDQLVITLARSDSDDTRTLSMSGDVAALLGMQEMA
jgi:tRNA threonylcarbamoyladenosine biosynthesis protein TsaE